MKSNLDVFLLANGVVIASSTSNNLSSQVPYEFTGAQGTGTLQVVIRLTAGDVPSRLKYVNYGANNSGNVAIQFATNSPTVIPHSAAVNAMSVGASPFFDQKAVESFSSKGPATILFSPTGTPVAPTIRAKPDSLSTDGVSNSFFGGFDSIVGAKLFFGTSAATPNAAAVAALVIQANPSFTPAQVYSRLKATADPNVSGGVEFVGAGLVAAYRAVVGQPTAAPLPVSDGFEAGGPAAVASYVSGSGTSALVFRYVVSAGQSSPDLDYGSTGALSLDGGSIVNALSNPAILTLPAPGSSGSLGANKAIVVDAVAPTVVAYRVLFGSRSFNLIGSSRVNLPWQITGIQAVFSEPIAAGAAASLTGVSPTAFAGLGTNTQTWGISTLTVGAFSTSLLGTGPNALKDAAGNGLFGPNIDTDRGQSLLASDFFAVIGSGAEIASGATVGLGRVLFDVAPGASGSISVALVGFPTTSLAGADTSDIPVTGTVDGFVRVSSSTAAVPEPATLAQAGLAMLAGTFALRRHRRRDRPRPMG